ncbi:molybdopterin-dependent oxidoreductase [Paracoccus sp. IB05]|uniref:molybdopterin-dependent oxidoreductase n=1 Tax=Paracoccus sp. IB05 TaxID=2779367 RepID=UPI0018E71D55|nr:molybdopterin-dependent oxidoreductase [Paracoccus sp. IB05]MBJ2153188.1 molybdopterin-dependent oxidoreductase [Paracoccus sp. IB05]
MFTHRIIAATLLILPFSAASQAQDIYYELDGGVVSGELYADAIMELPVHELSTSTAVTEGIQHFEGHLMRDVLALLRREEGEVVTLGALNGYEIDIPMRDFHRFDVILAWRMNGQTLHPRDKGPYWIVYPRDQHQELQDIRYDIRWIWQLNRIEIR